MPGWFFREPCSAARRGSSALGCACPMWQLRRSCRDRWSCAGVRHSLTCYVSALLFRRRFIWCGSGPGLASIFGNTGYPVCGCPERKVRSATKLQRWPHPGCRIATHGDFRESRESFRFCDDQPDVRDPSLTLEWARKNWGTVPDEFRSFPWGRFRDDIRTVSKE